MKFVKIWVVTAILLFIVPNLLARLELPSIQTNKLAVGMPWLLNPGATGWLYMVIGAIVAGWAFTYIFLQGYKGRGWTEGIRFGLWVTLFASFYENLGYAAYLPMGRRLLVEAIVVDFITFLICGLCAALLAGKGASASRSASA